MQLQLFISAFAFISAAVGAVALPHHSAGELGTPIAIREGGTSGCNSVPQCCQNTHSSKDKTVIQGLKIFGLDKDAEKAQGAVATKCEPMEGLLNLNLLNGCKSTANGLIFLGCIPITLNL
ncbi:hypothetical protein AJ78_03327 [Emergomyces pasteurianus Ep9510]|uniref:Hydrophobin n=1 Tax=Emergomyces pasteurianus Ep9510 TaxID=1447872 RepID=A0A1J9PKW5_9EURO|nr:hypothetical protein AJ78_03327 [Emergomyces pasteurianus Ep9510]